MSSSQTTDSPQVKLILDWAEGFKKGDKDYIAKHLHKDHRRITYPRSLNRPELTKEEWLARAEEILKCWTAVDVSYTSFSLNILSFGLFAPTDDVPLHHRDSGKGYPSRSYLAKRLN